MHLRLSRKHRVSRSQFHAFSLVQLAGKPGTSIVCMAVVGDWTEAVHAALKRPSCRPAWIYGPFPSPFGAASNFDNLICVASGIGITPAISIVTSFAQTRRVNLVWVCRDPDLIEHYLRHICHDSAWTFIFYTGKRSLNLNDGDIGWLKGRPTLKIFQGRPDLEDLVCSIVDNISNDLGLSGLPPDLQEKSNQFMHTIFQSSPMTRFATRMESLLATYSVSEIHDMALEFSIEAMNDELRVEDGLGNRPRPSQLLDGFTLEGFIRLFIHHGFESSREDLKEQYDRIDTDGNGVIDKEEFEALVLRISEDGLVRSPVSGEKSPQRPASCSVSPTRSRAISPTRSLSVESRLSSLGSEDTPFTTRIPFVGEPAEESREQRDSKLAVYELESEIKETWQMMYCGGAAPVLAGLKQIRDKYKIDLEVESFDW